MMGELIKIYTWLGWLSSPEGLGLQMTPEVLAEVANKRNELGNYIVNPPKADEPANG